MTSPVPIKPWWPTPRDFKPAQVKFFQDKALALIAGCKECGGTGRQTIVRDGYTVTPPCDACLAAVNRALMGARIITKFIPQPLWEVRLEDTPKTVPWAPPKHGNSWFFHGSEGDQHVTRLFRFVLKSRIQKADYHQFHDYLYYGRLETVVERLRDIDFAKSETEKEDLSARAIVTADRIRKATASGFKPRLFLASATVSLNKQGLVSDYTRHHSLFGAYIGAHFGRH
jgi:hypothetical protein